MRSAARRVHGGFTLIEMLVVLAIIVVITSITVLGQLNFNRSLLLTDTAYTIALSARETQSFGLSSRLFGAVPNAGYGLHFTLSSPNSSSYIQFADVLNSPYPTPSNCSVGTAGYPDAKPGNCIYDGAGETVQTYTLGQGFYISAICGVDSTNGPQSGCYTYANYPGLSLDMVFARPNTGAILNFTNTGYAEHQLVKAWIVLTSPQNTSRCIEVTEYGQVSVNSTCS